MDIRLDNAEKIIINAKDFGDFLAEVENNSDWKVLPTQNIKIISADKLAENIDMSDYPLIQDTMSNTGLALKIKGENTIFQLGSSSMSTLCARAGISGPALGHLSSKDLANVLNKCLATRDNKLTLLRISYDKVRALHSGNNGSYTPLCIKDLFRVSENEMDSYEGSVFRFGYYSHSITQWRYCIKDEAIENKYVEMFNRNGIRVSEIKPAISITTSDTGHSSVSLSYSLETKGSHIVFGDNIKIIHEGRVYIADFREAMQEAFAGYKASLQDIDNLEYVEINHPIDCIKNIMTKYKFPKRTISKCVENYIGTFGEGRSNALKVYVAGISSCIDDSNEKLTAKGRMSLEEKIAKILITDMSEYDYPEV